MITLLKIPLLKPIFSITATFGVLFVAMDPTVKVAIIVVCGNIMVLLVGWMLRGKLSEIHVLINSRMTELIKETKTAARAEGKQEGVQVTEAKQAIKEQGIAEGKKEKGA